MCSIAWVDYTDDIVEAAYQKKSDVGKNYILPYN